MTAQPIGAEFADTRTPTSQFDASAFGVRAGRKRTGQASSYDFRRPIQLSREHTRVLTNAMERFARQATTSFSSVLRTIAPVDLESIEQKSYVEYVSTLESTTYMTIVETDPLPGSGVLEMPIGSVMLCIDHMLGGPGAIRQPNRSLTEIEGQVVSQLFENKLLPDMREAFKRIAPLSLSVKSVEYSPQFALASSTSDIMVVTTFNVKFHDHQTRLTFALPFSGLNPLLVAAAAPTPAQGREAEKERKFSSDLRRQFQDVPMTMSVRQPSIDMTAAELVALKTGDVLRLGRQTPWEVAVNEEVFAHAMPGVKNQNRAARIISVSKKNEDPQS